MILKLQNSCRLLVFIAAASLLAACTTTEPAKNSKNIPQQSDRNLLSQLGKSDIDRLADVEMRENTQTLRMLMTKLYKRNPRELRKNTTASAEEMVTSVFENQHGWQFKEIGEVQDSVAIQQALLARNVSVSVRGRALRVSPNVYNDEQDVQAFVDALKGCLS